MAELIPTGGCYNGMRYAVDGAGQGARNWVADYNTAAIMNDGQILILAVNIDGDDMNDATDATFKIQWENNDDAPGIWNDLAATGELKWATVSDLIDGNAVIEAEDCGANVVNCAGKGWPHADGIEKEGANGFTRTIIDDIFQDFHWAIDLSDADSANQDHYNFRLTTDIDSVIGTMVALLQVVIAGEIAGITKNADRSSVIGGVTVTAYRSDEAGSDPKPTNAAFVGQVVSHASTGVYAIGSLFAGAKYFLHFYKDDTEDLSDGSPEITAVAL